MLTIGLTGGIACGKSIVSDYFNKLGIPIIDTDVIARQLVEPKQPALKEIIQLFGNDIVNSNNELKRKDLREIIFNSKLKRQQLEAILHPKIKNTALYELSLLKQYNEKRAPYCIVVIPLLFETKSDYPIDRILVVDCSKQLQIERMMNRDKISREQCLAILDSQISQTERLKLANDVIKNSNNINSCISQVNHINSKYLNLVQSIMP